MDNIAQHIQKLKVSDDLFKDIKFYVTGKLSDEVLKLLTDGGAKHDHHITDFMTHLITGEEPNESDVGVVKDVYEKPVVTQRWVVLSAKCGKQLPVEGFNPDSSQMFSSVVASVSKVGLEDTKTIWALLSFMGGHFQLAFTNKCTHLILGKPEGEKYARALENDENIHIVTPDWLTDSIAEGERLDESEYHPRLLKVPKDAKPIPQLTSSRERRKREKEKEKEREREKEKEREIEREKEKEKEKEQQKAEELKKKEKEESKKKETEKKSLFDTLQFSDDEEENSKGNSLLDQLKTSQPWKQPSTKPTVTTRAAASTSFGGTNKPREPLMAPIGLSIANPPQTVTPRAVTPQPTPAPKGVAGGAGIRLGGPVTTPPASEGSSDTGPPKATPPGTIPLVRGGPGGGPGSVPSSPGTPMIAGLGVGAMRMPGQAPTSVVGVPTPPTQSSTGNVARATPPIPSRVTPPNTSRSTPPGNALRATPPNTSRATPPNSARGTPPNASRETPPNTTPQTPPATPTAMAPGVTASPMIARPTLTAARMTPLATSRGTLPSVLSPRIPSMPLTITNPGVRAPGDITPTMISNVPQQVHTVAIPGAVVRLPHGFTPQKLQMMTPTERHSFLQNLHQKQLQDQQARGKPRAGKPPGPQYKQGVRYAGPGIHTQSTPGTPGTPTTPVSTWPGGQPTQGVRPTMASGGPGVMSGQVGGQQVVTSGAPGEGVRPGWPAQGQQQQFSGGQPPPGTRVVVGQPGWQQQPGVRTQAPAAPGQSPTTQTLLPQHMQQLQLQIQQLCQHFPHLTHQEASQLIQRIPGHYRQIQQLDNAQRNEYLAQLEPKEKQVVTYFYVKKQQQQLYQRHQMLQQQQQQQNQAQKVGTPQQSPHSWQQQGQPGQPSGPQQGVQGGQYPPMTAHGRPIPGRPLTQGYPGSHPGGVVSPGQGSPHMVAAGQLTPQQQLTPHVSPLASPHGHSPIQRSDGTIISHQGTIQGSPVPQNLVNQQNLVNPKTKTALAIHLTNRGVISQGPQGPIEVPPHVVQKPGLSQEPVQGPGGEQVMLYQRRALGNITGTVTNNLVRPQGQGTPVGVVAGHGYPRPVAPPHPATATPPMAATASHYPRPHLVGHDINIMLPRELCLVGCVFYIADYHGEVTVETLTSWKRVIQQHAGEVVPIYETARVTHLLCKNQKSPVFMQAVRENKRCITIFWLNDVLLRGKMAPPWQAIHLPTPFGNDNKPCEGLIVSVSGFENEERTIYKLMLQLVGAKYTGYFSKHNSLLICKRLEGPKVAKAREWKRPVANGVWLSEVLLGQNTPPLVYHGTRYQHYVDDPLRIDPSLAAHLFNAWKYPISVSKESVEKAKAMREMALRKRKTEADGDQENKRACLEPPPALHLGTGPTQGPAQPPSVGLSSGPPTTGPTLPSMGFGGPLTIINKELPPELLRPRILLSSIKNKEEIERKLLELGGYLAKTSIEATHLVMGSTTAQRTVKFMCAISCCKYILSLQWILDSHAESKFMPEDKYTLDMPEFERVFQFSLKETLAKPNRRQLFHGKTFYLTPSVVPGRTWLREIIECAGGMVESKRRLLKDIKERNKDGTYQYLTIATEADSHLIKDVLQEEMPVYNAEFVLGSILKQEINFKMALYIEE